MLLPGSEILFDACSPRGLEMANRKVIKAGGMDDSAILRWGIQRAKDMERWDSRIAVVAEYPIFRNMRRALSIREKWGTFVCDALRIMSMVHLRLGAGRSVGEAKKPRQNPVSQSDRSEGAPAPVKPHRVCPWWLGYVLASPVRRIFQQPAKVRLGTSVGA